MSDLLTHLARHDQEIAGQIEWFESLLEALEAGKIEDAKSAVQAAIEMLERCDLTPDRSRRLLNGLRRGLIKVPPLGNGSLVLKLATRKQ